MLHNFYSPARIFNIQIIKYFLLIILIVLTGKDSLAADIIILRNAQTYEGKVTKIRNCQVTFSAGGDRYHIPAADIHSIKFASQDDRVYRRYLNELEVDPSKCVNGRLDAAQYHGKKSSHIALGFLFGPLAMVGTAMADPTPDKGKLTTQRSENSEMFSDPDYLNCYRKRAKGKLIGAESIGFGISLLMILLITPTYLANK
jgi:hypothetical protein